jgi:hypothetical protein
MEGRAFKMKGSKEGSEEGKRVKEGRKDVKDEGKDGKKGGRKEETPSSWKGRQMGYLVVDR